MPMAKFTKTCRVCGKTYTACFTPARAGVFRWQDVACSPECGNIYLDRIIASRKKNVDVATVAEEAEVADLNLTIESEGAVESEVARVDSGSAESDYDEEGEEDYEEDDDHDINSSDEEE